MSDWSGDYTYDRIKYTGREIHLQGLYRGFGIERIVATKKQGPYYYFLGDPHTSGTYLAGAGAFYKSLLVSLATAWGNQGSAPQGQVNGPGGMKAHYRGTTLWKGD